MSAGRFAASSGGRAAARLHPLRPGGSRGRPWMSLISRSCRRSGGGAVSSARGTICGWICGAVSTCRTGSRRGACSPSSARRRSTTRTCTGCARRDRGRPDAGGAAPVPASDLDPRRSGRRERRRRLGRPAAARQARFRLRLRRRRAARQGGHARPVLAGRGHGDASRQRRRLRRRVRQRSATRPRPAALGARSGCRARRAPRELARDRAHRSLPSGSRRAAGAARFEPGFAQATWRRHLLFGTVLGELERRLPATLPRRPRARPRG
jgi:hypothetical protein